MIAAVLRYFGHIKAACRQNHLSVVHPYPVQEFFAGGAGVLLEELAQVLGIEPNQTGKVT
ncbi:hypothetical protein D3C84_1197260 [compost metagenome]